MSGRRGWPDAGWRISICLGKDMWASKALFLAAEIMRLHAENQFKLSAIPAGRRGRTSA
jgi:hypothetical protein